MRHICFIAAALLWPSGADAQPADACAGYTPDPQKTKKCMTKEAAMQYINQCGQPFKSPGAVGGAPASGDCLANIDFGNDPDCKVCLCQIRADQGSATILNPTACWSEVQHSSCTLDETVQLRMYSNMADVCGEWDGAPDMMNDLGADTTRRQACVSGLRNKMSDDCQFCYFKNQFTGFGDCYKPTGVDIEKTCDYTKYQLINDMKTDCKTENEFCMDKIATYFPDEDAKKCGACLGKAAGTFPPPPFDFLKPGTDWTPYLEMFGAATWSCMTDEAKASKPCVGEATKALELQKCDEDAENAKVPCGNAGVKTPQQCSADEYKGKKTCAAQQNLAAKTCVGCMMSRIAVSGMMKKGEAPPGPEACVAELPLTCLAADQTAIDEGRACDVTANPGCPKETRLKLSSTCNSCMLRNEKAMSEDDKCKTNIFATDCITKYCPATGTNAATPAPQGGASPADQGGSPGQGVSPGDQGGMPDKDKGGSPGQGGSPGDNKGGMPDKGGSPDKGPDTDSGDDDAPLAKPDDKPDDKPKGPGGFKKFRARLKMATKKTLRNFCENSLSGGPKTCKVLARKLAKAIFKSLKGRLRQLYKVAVQYYCAVKDGMTLAPSDYDNGELCVKVDEETTTEMRRVSALQTKVCGDDTTCSVLPVVDVESEETDSAVVDQALADAISDPDMQAEGVGASDPGSIEDITPLPIPPPLPSPTNKDDDDSSIGTGGIVGLVLGCLTVVGLGIGAMFFAGGQSTKRTINFGEGLQQEVGREADYMAAQGTQGNTANVAAL